MASLLPQPRHRGCSAPLREGSQSFFLDPPKPFWCCQRRAARALVVLGGKRGREGRRGGSGVRYFSIPASAGPANKGAIELRPLRSVKQKPSCISSGAFDLPPPRWDGDYSCPAARAPLPASPHKTPQRPGMSQRHRGPFPCIPKPSQIPNFGGARPSAGAGGAALCPSHSSPVIKAGALGGGGISQRVLTGVWTRVRQ